MRIFLTYPSELKATAEPIAFSLRSRGHKVFLDKDDLPAGKSYDDQIQKAIQQSDVLIYLISPASVEKGRYTLTEMEFARAAWSHPANRVLPVMIEPTDMTKIPNFLKGVTLLEPKGNVTAEVAAAIERLRGSSVAFREVVISGALCGAALFLSLILLRAFPSIVPSGPSLSIVQEGLVFGLPISALLFFYGRQISWRLLLPIGSMAIAAMLANPFFNQSVALTDSISAGNFLEPAAVADVGSSESVEQVPIANDERQRAIDQLNRLNDWGATINRTTSWMIYGSVMMLGVILGTILVNPSLNNVPRALISIFVVAVSTPIAAEIAFLGIGDPFLVGYGALYSVIGGVLGFWHARGQAT